MSTKLNLGCGSEKLPGYINVDIDKNLKPDLVLDFSKYKLPYKDKTVNEVVIFHTIEHIQKRLHKPILGECSRVLKKGGKIYLSYPNFWECAQRWYENKNGHREFWEQTLYGRQAFPSDFHVCAVDPDELKGYLLALGFDGVAHYSEDAPNHYNTITVGTKSNDGYLQYEDVLNKFLKSVRVR